MQCSICLEEILPLDTVSILDCSHIYHCYCIKKWINTSIKDCCYTCPECRYIHVRIPEPKLKIIKKNDERQIVVSVLSRKRNGYNITHTLIFHWAEV